MNRMDYRMPFKMNIEYNPNEFRVFKPQLVGIYRSDTQPVSNNATDLYLRYVSKPLNRPLELEKGFSEQTKKPVINNKYESLLEWIGLNKQLFQLNQPPEQAAANCLDAVDFVASTGTLSFLLKMPYDLDNKFNILAEMLNGTIYLKIIRPKRVLGVSSNYSNLNHRQYTPPPRFCVTPPASPKPAPPPPFAGSGDYDLNGYCEQKFRQAFTEKINSSESADFGESKLNEWVSFGGKKVGDKKIKNHKVTEKITFVFRTKCRKHSIIFSDEVDSFEQINPMNPDHFGIVKFKLIRRSQADRNDHLDALRKLR